MRLGRALVATCAGVLACGGVATGAPSASRLVLVKLDPAAGSQGRADVREALAATSSWPLGAGWRAYRLPVPVTLAEARADLATTAADGGVELDRTIELAGVPNDTLWSRQWDMAQIGMVSAWDSSPGSAPVVVAVVDTGADLAANPELSPAAWRNPGEIPANGVDDDHDGYVDDVYGWDFAHNDASLMDDASADLHGTHVAGTIAAVRNNSAGIAGMSANAQLMSLKFIGESGSGKVSDAMLALAYARAHGARVVNASWGAFGYSEALCDAVQETTAAGAVFVAAAGNEGRSTDERPMYPASCPGAGIVAVGASDATDALATFSQWGPLVDLAAPGVSILSTAPGDGSSYVNLAGTSMAAPHVAGAAALILGVHPQMAVSALRNALVESGTPVAALSGKVASGRRLDVPQALSWAASPPTDTTPPEAFSLRAPAEGGFTVARPRLSWQEATDAQSGVRAYRLYIGGAQVASVDGTRTAWTLASPLAEGTHTWRVDAVDGEGLVRSSGTRTFGVDATPPQIFEITSPTETTSSSPLRVTWAPSADAVSGLAGYAVSYAGLDMGLVAGPAATSWQSPWEITGSPATIIVTAWDRAGNSVSATSSIRQVFPTMTRPTVVAPISGASVAARPVLSWTVGADATQVRVFVDSRVVASLAPGTTSLQVGPYDPASWHYWWVEACTGATCATAGGEFTVEGEMVLPPPRPPVTDYSAPASSVTPPPFGSGFSPPGFRAIVTPLPAPKKPTRRACRKGAARKAGRVPKPCRVSPARRHPPRGGRTPSTTRRRA